MSLLSDLGTDKDVQAEGDSLGGSYIVDSGLYPAILELVYMSVSKGNALAMNCVFKTASGAELKQPLWVKSGDAKGNKNYYTDAKGVKHNLPGMNQANAICTLTVGKTLDQMETTEKVVKLWDSELKAEKPTPVQVIKELRGQQIVLGVIRQIVDKNIKDDNGKYVPSGDTREENDIDKVFQAETNLTVTEFIAGVDEAKFIHSWKKKNEGVTRNKASSKKAGTTPGIAAGTSSESLFDD